MEHLVLVASYSLLAAGPILFLVLWFVEAPYGKFASTSSVSRMVTLGTELTLGRWHEWQRFSVPVAETLARRSRLCVHEKIPVCHLRM